MPRIGSGLNPDQSLNFNDYCSPATIINILDINNVCLIMQSDSNLVLWGYNGNIGHPGPIVVNWATNTNATGATRAVMQLDGNFVLYNQSTPVWETGTAGHPGAFLDIIVGGNFSPSVLGISYHGNWIWSSGPIPNYS